MAERGSTATGASHTEAPWDRRRDLLDRDARHNTTFTPRAYVIHGSRQPPGFFRGYRLGVDTNRDGIHSTDHALPHGSLARASLGFSTRTWAT